MRILKILAAVISAAVLLTGGVLFLTSRGRSDAPVIVCSEEMTITASVNTTDEELLTYVTASDKQDGDLSDHIKVIRKKNFLDVKEKSAIITFAVSDSDNNVSSISRKLVFSDYHSPRISLSYDFIFPSNHSYRLGQYVTAHDVIDGDISAYTKIISTEFTNIKGEYAINLKVSNSMGDTTEINFNAIVTDEDYFDTKVRLNDYAAYVSVGEEIDYMSRIKDIYNKSPDKYDMDDIVLDTTGVDTSTPGVYNAFYRIFGADGEIITMTRLLVIVTED